MPSKTRYSLLKLGLLIKGLLNFFFFGLGLLFLPQVSLISLGFSQELVFPLRIVSIIAVLLGSIYTWGAMDFEKRKLIAKITYLDALIYPLAILFLGIFIKMPLVVWISAVLVGVAGIILLIGRGYELLFLSKK